jgi:hypothetical protein
MKITLQNIFNHVALHLMNQKKKAMAANGQCRYRTTDGLRCAVGCLIPEDEYDEHIEESTLNDLINQKRPHLSPTLERLIYSSDKSYNLLSDLQLLHDESNSRNWESNLKELAKTYNLQYLVKKSKC